MDDNYNFGWILIPDDEEYLPTFCRSLQDLGEYISHGAPNDCGFEVKLAFEYETGGDDGR